MEAVVVTINVMTDRPVGANKKAIAIMCNVIENLLGGNVTVKSHLRHLGIMRVSRGILNSIKIIKNKYLKSFSKQINAIVNVIVHVYQCAKWSKVHKMNIRERKHISYIVTVFRYVEIG